MQNPCLLKKCGSNLSIWETSLPESQELRLSEGTSEGITADAPGAFAL